MHHPARPARQHHHRTRAARATRIPIPRRRPARARIPVTVIAAPVAITVIIPITPSIPVTTTIAVMVVPTVVIPPITAAVIARAVVPTVARAWTRPRRTIRTTRRRHIAGSQKQGRHQGQEEGGRFHDKGRPTTATSSCSRPTLDSFPHHVFKKPHPFPPPPNAHSPHPTRKTFPDSPEEPPHT